MELKYSDVLDRILPARQWEENGKHYRQKLSNQPSTKKDVNNLTEKLDLYLEQFKAREVGICPIKEQLYLQCFSKLLSYKRLYIIYLSINIVRTRVIYKLCRTKQQLIPLANIDYKKKKKQMRTDSSAVQ